MRRYSLRIGKLFDQSTIIIAKLYGMKMSFMCYRYGVGPCELYIPLFNECK